MYAWSDEELKQTIQELEDSLESLRRIGSPEQAGEEPEVEGHMYGWSDENLKQAIAKVEDALQTLRELAHGIYPPLLADKGIVAALDAHIRKVGVRATLEVAPGLADLRFDDRTEACVYFCCLQALQNVVRHAGDTTAIVRLSAGPQVLTFEVVDRGAGFDPAATDRGMGLQIMQDRVDALEGSLEVVSAPGAGTTVTGRIRARALEAAR